MPRTLAETMRLRGPFGGLMSARAKRQINPLDCLDSLNVHTVYGDIRRRPGFRIFAAEGDPGNYWENGRFYNLKSITIGDRRYLYSWFQGRRNEDSRQWAFHSLFDSHGAEVERISTGYWEVVPSVAEARGRLYMASEGGNGGDYPGLKWYLDSNDEIQSARIGVGKPTSMNSVLPTNGDFPAGEYRYRVTWYNADADVESAASPYKGDTIPEHGGFTIFLPPGGVPEDQPQITHWRIYRKRQDVDAVYHRVATVPATGDSEDNYYHDIVYDEIDLSYLGELAISGWLPPKSYAIAWYKRRMWWSVGLDSPILVRWSEVDQPERVNPINSLEVGAGDSITALFPAFGRLYVFKTRSVWAIFGDSPETFSVHQISRDAGCDAPRSVVEIGNAIYFCNVNGPYRIVGDRTEYLGADLAEHWQQYKQEEIKNLSAVHENDLGLYLITGQNSGGEFWYQLAYDYRRHKWHRWEIGEMTVCCQHRPATSWENHILFGLAGNEYGGHFRRTIGIFNRSQHDYANMPNYERPIDWRWESPDMDFGIERPKKVFFISLAYEGTNSDSPTTFRLEYMHNSDGVYHLLAPEFDSQLGSHLIKRRVARLCDTIRMKVSGTSRAVDRITALDIAATPIGHR